MTTIIREDRLRTLVPLEGQALDIVEDGFARLARGDVTIPPIMGLEIAEKNGAADVKTAYVRGWDAFAIKISTRFFDNSARGLPSGSGLMALIDSDTGRPRTILLDNGYLTTIRTALAGALAAKYGAAEHVDTVVIFGAGSQARWQARALRLVRDFRRVRIVARSSERAQECARVLAAELGVAAQAVDDGAAALADAQVAITTTPAASPILDAAWLPAGLHITAMGADAAHKHEIDPAVWARADLKICDLRAQCRERGELRHGLAAGAVRERDVHELGELITGQAEARRDGQQISLCDLTGVGVQDTAIARYAWMQADAA